MFQRIATAAVGAFAITGVSLLAAGAANAASIANTTAHSATSYTVVAKHFDDDAKATITLRSTASDDVVTTRTRVSDDGRLTYTFVPPTAGRYTVRFSAAGESTTKTIKVGTAYHRTITVKAKDTSDRSTTIHGTAAAGSTILVKVYDPAGEREATKTITVDSAGHWSTTFGKATDDGAYDVRATYVATGQHWGSTTYTDTFDRD